VIFDSLALWGKLASALTGMRAASSISHYVIGVDTLMASGKFAIRYLQQLFPKLPRLLPALFRIRRRYKSIFPKSPIIPVRGGLNIAYTLRELQPDLPIIDGTFRFVGPSINPQVRHDDFPFDQLTHETLVYISLGTVHHRDVAFYRQCFEAFGSYPAQFVLSIGKQTSIESLGVIPANFIVRPSVPQLEILQRASVFFTHGGVNSVHEGLYYGVPLVVIPHQIEQLLNAKQVEQSGAGLVIDQFVLGKPVTAAELRPALEKVLSDGAYRAGALHLQEKLRATGGYRQAADEIQAYVAQAH
jgi:MGT family glycosyltransferase